MHECGCTGAAAVQTTGAMPCLGPHKCSATWRQRTTVFGVKYDATVVPSRGQMDLAVRVDCAEGHLIADDPRSVEQRSGKFDVAVADNKVDRNAEDIRTRAQFILANVRAAIGPPSACSLLGAASASLRRVVRNRRRMRRCDGVPFFVLRLLSAIFGSNARCQTTFRFPL